MVTLASLWLPILLSAVVVFIVSSLLHMILKYHRSDWAKLPNEDAVMDALRGTPPGDYMMPHSTGPEMRNDPAFVERMKRGPMAVVTVMQGDMMTSFRNALIGWFVYSLIVSVFAAYVAGRALHPGAAYPEVFRFIGTVAFLGYGMGLAQMSIWYGRKWSTTTKSLIDALIYALLSAGVFGWLWPK
jgi:hypothetical protein